MFFFSPSKLFSIRIIFGTYGMCTFLDGFFGRIFWTDFWTDFLDGFFGRIFERIFLKDFLDVVYLETIGVC